ncbi:MAG: dTDP-4-dehydrorhamnose 3,5-epimerase [Candidatus Omnitrophica bacterium CG11_big_fil_rev_8_21_14_0_20_64_10]|nr:MAG: dTDP-4-dehydrorhamnose 3,5-epimerase [Candidatus Omnitrophica bacterium CG11_big_fil_rev_8_21_14_0_20_64_10]
MIEGVRIIPLKVIPDERGRVMHMLKATDPHFEKFGEIYFSSVYPGVVKGWHKHSRMTINYAVPVGMIKLALYDDRPDSRSRGEIQEVFLGESQYQLVQVPPFIWNGFKGMGTTPAIVANCATIPHDPDEIERLDPASGAIPYDWRIQHR